MQHFIADLPHGGSIPFGPGILMTAAAKQEASLRGETPAEVDKAPSAGCRQMTSLLLRQVPAKNRDLFSL